jgi:hypothetical protein
VFIICFDNEQVSFFSFIAKLTKRKLNCEESTKDMKDIGEPPVLRKQRLYFVLIYQIRNQTLLS